MSRPARKSAGLDERLLRATLGAGPLLQRDYWAVVRDCRLKPHEVLGVVARRFWDFAPAETVVFARADRTKAPLVPGDELMVKIRMAGTFTVRVLHVDSNSLTLGTIEGHPEAGRITFGAYYNERGDVIFHIRSRARSSSMKYLTGFFALGEAMQTNTWADFVNCVARTFGSGVLSRIHAEKRVIDDEPPSTWCQPTFIAKEG